MQYSVLVAALCATSAMAIMVTQPSKNTNWSDNDSNTIKWDSVSTDPSTVNILLVNQQVTPPISTTLASNVQTSDGSYTVPALTGTGPGYQINLVSAQSGNSAILAQSEQFSLQAGGGSSSMSMSMSMSSTGSMTTATLTTATVPVSTIVSGSILSTAAATVTRTASGTSTMSTATGSATGSSTASASGSASGSVSGSAASATPTGGAEAKLASLAAVAVAGLFAVFA